MPLPLAKLLRRGVDSKNAEGNKKTQSCEHDHQRGLGRGTQLKRGVGRAAVGSASSESPSSTQDEQGVPRQKGTSSGLPQQRITQSPFVEDIRAAVEQILGCDCEVYVIQADIQPRHLPAEPRRAIFVGIMPLLHDGSGQHSAPPEIKRAVWEIANRHRRHCDLLHPTIIGGLPLRQEKAGVAA